jgi:hypothetical protein
MPTDVSPSVTASAMRFFPEELNIPGHVNNTNKQHSSAPIRPERVSSEDERE